MPKSVSKKRIKHQKFRHRSLFRSPLFLGIIVLSFLALLIIFGKLAGFLGNLGQSISPDSSHGAVKRYEWDGKEVFNLAVKSKGIYLLSINPDENLVNVLKIPDEVYTNLPFNFGYWPMRSVYDLGQAERNPIGALLLKETVSTSLGTAVDGYLIAYQKLADSSIEEMIDKIRKNPFFSLNLLGQSKTDLSVVEFFRLWWAIRNTRSDKIIFTDLSKTAVTEASLMLDGSQALNFDKSRLDQLVQNLLADGKLSQEGVNIGIFNATDHPGLAEKAARVVTNFGGRVIFTANSPDRLQTSVVLGKLSLTKNRLLQIFAPGCLNNSKGFLGLFKGVESSKCFLANFDINSSRAEVNLILGEDYYLRYNTK